jgi:hypothetical protein
VDTRNNIYVDIVPLSMPKWKKDETVFTVSLSYHPRRGTLCLIPKPIVEALGNPEQITFVMKGRKIEVTNEPSAARLPKHE